MTLDGVDRHADDAADLGRIEVLLIAQRDHQALPLRQRGHELAQTPRRQRIARRRRDGQFRRVVEADAARTGAAHFVDAAPRRHLPQPEEEMRARLDAIEVAIELQEDVLRDLFAAVAVGEEMPGDAEDHRLVLADDGGEGVAVAAARAAQDLFRLAHLGEQGAHVGIYTWIVGKRLRYAGGGGAGAAGRGCSGPACAGTVCP